MRWCAVAVVFASCGSGDPVLRIERAGTAADGEGEVTSDAGIDCGDDCSVQVPRFTIVPLDTVVPRGVQFMGWQGGGCGGDVACEVTVTGDVTVIATFDEKRELVDLPAVTNREVDLLFVDDNSPATVEQQLWVVSAFPAMIDVLDDLEGGLPDLHIGVVSVDMGTLGVPIGDENCAESDGGVLRKGTSDGDQCPEVSGNYLTNTNFTGTIGEAFRCMYYGGSEGCGFEQPLESMRAALDNNPANAGFLRPTAHLGVLIMADEDDCSAKDPAFFGPETAELGPLDGFRCFEKAIRCDEGRDVDLRAEGPKTGCVPDETSTYLHDVQTRYVDFVRGLKPTARSIAVATIIGDPAPVEIGRRMPTGTTTPRPDLVPSCEYMDTGGMTNSADPGIRLHAFAEAFGARGTHGRVCRNDYTSTLVAFGAAVRRMVGYPCIDGELYASDACELALVASPGTPNEVAEPLPMCTPALDNPPCWHAVTGDALCGAKPRIVVEHATPPPADSAVIGSCRID